MFLRVSKGIGFCGVEGESLWFREEIKCLGLTRLLGFGTALLMVRMHRSDTMGGCLQAPPLRIIAWTPKRLYLCCIDAGGPSLGQYGFGCMLAQARW